MEKLTKAFRIIHEGNKLFFPLTEDGMTGETFPSVNAKAVEFDDYEEAKAYVESNGLVYVDSSFEME